MAVRSIVLALLIGCSGAVAPNDASTPGTDSGPPPPPRDSGPPSDAAMTIAGWMDSCLPDWGNPSGDRRTMIIQAIVDACDRFGPPEDINPGWRKEYCWAQMMGTVLAESSYDPMAIAEPGSDPTVGLTQIRFSSVVCGYYTGSTLATIESMGCGWAPDFAAHASEQCYMSDYWRTTGGDAAHTAWMQQIPCNIGLSVWAYYLFATAGGDASMTLYQYQICAGQGIPANLATGLVSYLMGPSNQFASITSLDQVPAGAQHYVTQIKDVMDCALGPVSGTHPLFIPLHPNTSQYCR